MTGIGRLRTASERQKDLVKVLDRYSFELTSLKSMIKTVEAERELRTAAIAVELKKLRAVEDTLVDYLDDIDPGDKGSAHQFAHQLFHGSKEEKRLGKIMDDLSRAKIDLLVRMQVASVGVTRIVGDAVFANAEIIKRIDGCLVKLFGQGNGLKIAKLLKDGSPDGTSFSMFPQKSVID